MPLIKRDRCYLNEKRRWRLIKLWYVLKPKNFGM